MQKSNQRTALAVSLLVSSLFALAAIAADGLLDPSFGDGGVAWVTPDGAETIGVIPSSVIELPDGKLMFAGSRQNLIPDNPPFEPEVRGMLLRMNADGTPDASFGDTSVPGMVDLPDLAGGTRIQAIESFVRLDDGSMIAVGTGVSDAPSEGFVVKLDADGALDPAFGDGGATILPDFFLHAVAIDDAGRIVVCGEHVLDYHFTSSVLRLDANGALDPAFGDAGIRAIDWSDATLDGRLEDIAVDADGRIVVAGRFSAYGPGLDSDFAIARLAGDGSFDTSFADGGFETFHDPAETSTKNGIDRVRILDDGRILFAGYHATTAGTNTRGLVFARLDASGAVDASYGDAATPGFLDVDAIPDAPAIDASALAIDGAGNAVATVTYFSSSEQEQAFAVRATADGALDASFADAGLFRLDLAADGLFTDALAMTLQRDGRIVIGARTSRDAASPIIDLAAIRLLAAAGADRIFVNGFEPRPRRVRE